MRWKLPAGADLRRRLALRGLLAWSCLCTVVPGFAREDTTGETDVALELYRLRLFQAASRLRLYPPEALERRLQGTTGLELVVAGDGSVKTLRMTASSGEPVLDEQAAALVRAAVPLTQIPLALQNRAFAIRLAIVFRLPG